MSKMQKNLKGGEIMPFGDRTGPFGAGPRTGRAMGYCAGYSIPGYLNRPGRWFWGRGFGRGAGRGWRHWFYATGIPGWARFGYFGVPYFVENEKDFLMNQANLLKEELKNIESRLEQLENSAKEE